VFKTDVSLHRPGNVTPLITLLCDHRHSSRMANTYPGFSALMRYINSCFTYLLTNLLTATRDSSLTAAIKYD